MASIDACLVGARRFGPSSNEPVEGVSTDSRQIERGAVYVAIRGERFDGHAFIPAAVKAGARALIVDIEPSEPPTIPTWLVPDTRVALGQVAAMWRAKFDIPLAVIVGSNGKTTVKEMLLSILRKAYGDEAVLGSHGNFNNDIGVPLTLFRLSQRHRVAVLEVGTNHPGEIAALSAIAKPTVVVLTNAQREHQEFLAGVEGSARENGAAIEALPHDGTAVFPGDDACAPIWAAQAGARRMLRFGLRAATQTGKGATGAGQTPALDLHASANSQSAQFRAHLGDQAIDIALHIAGRHNVRNALAATAGARALGVPIDSISAGLAEFRPVKGRLCQLSTAGGATVIDDSYNANPDSVRAAIDVLAKTPSPRILVLGAMAEVGDKGPQFHAEVGRYARERGIDVLFALGADCSPTVEAFGDGAYLADDIDQLKARLQASVSKAATILVKGSRGMRMERIVDALTMVSTSLPADSARSAH